MEYAYAYAHSAAPVSVNAQHEAQVVYMNPAW